MRPDHKNHVRSYDFIEDRTQQGPSAAIFILEIRRISTLTRSGKDLRVRYDQALHKLDADWEPFLAFLQRDKVKSVGAQLGSPGGRAE